MLAEDVTINVLLELDTVGEEDICTQELKLSEETCRVPEHVVLEVLVVINVLSIASEKVTAIVELTETEVTESAGEDEENVGAVVSDRLMKFQVCSVDNPLFPKSLTEVV